MDAGFVVGALIQIYHVLFLVKLPEITKANDMIFISDMPSATA